MINYMDKTIFETNLNQALKELAEKKEVKFSEDWSYKIVPVKEVGKTLTTQDNYLRLGMLNEDNLSKVDTLSFNQVLKMLSCAMPLCPIWIDIELKEMKNNQVVVEIKTSLRFRKPKILHNQDSGHPPFRVVE